jgi:leucyl aminopeptidase
MFLVKKKRFNIYEIKKLGIKNLFECADYMIFSIQNPKLLHNLSKKYDLRQLNERNSKSLSFLKQNNRISNRAELNKTKQDIIGELVEKTNKDSLSAFIQKLQDYGTRFCLAENRRSIATWIMNKYKSIGYENTVLDSFWYDYRFEGVDYEIWQYNVVATIQGRVNPDNNIVIGGHYDSYNRYGNQFQVAPGADDDASGTAVTYEIARVFKENGYTPEKTMRFVSFAAEELMMSAEASGARDYAQKAYESGMKMDIMINNDMVANSSAGIDWVVLLGNYPGFEYVFDIGEKIGNEYTNLIVWDINGHQGDAYPFWELNFPTVYVEESDFSPNYHTPNDLFENLNMDYCREVSKLSLGMAIYSDIYPPTIDNLQITDLCTGNDLKIIWDKAKITNLKNYKINLGNSSGGYFKEFNTVDTTFTLTDLEDQVEYFIGISVVNDDDLEGVIIESSATPKNIPHEPVGFTSEPDWHKINLTWEANSEIDLAGYNVYSSKTEENGFEKLNNESAKIS